MKLIILVVIAFSFTLVAQAKPLKVKAKNYTCAELKNLVQEEGTVHIKGFGSLDVHSSASACNFRQEAYRTTWRTMDKRFCVAGYSCRNDHNEND